MRDLLLGVIPKDVDIATNAKPEEVEKLFEKSIMVGKAFGVVKVVLNGVEVEVATFRRDGPYIDGRKPESIVFSSEKEDALRRDFTINGLFYDPLHNRVIDFVEGQKDLQAKVIRAIGNPDQRFDEDKLRILRAVRFHGQLGFTIESTTAEAIRKNSILIHQVSMERVRDEWEKTLVSRSALEAFQATHRLGLWTPLFPGWKFDGDEYKRHWSLPQKDSDKAWTLWFLIHNQHDEERLAREALHWKLNKKLIQKMIYCLKSFRQFSDLTQVDPVDFALYLNKTNSRFAVEIYQLLFRNSIQVSFFKLLAEAETYFIQGELPAFLLTGDDLITAGVPPGPSLAKELARLYRIQLRNKIKSKAELLPQLKRTDE